MKILIVDDEKPARGELRYLLEQQEPEAEFVEAKNGLEALEILGKETVDVAFLDINMPGVNGLAVASAILEQPVTEDSPKPLVVFATAYDAHAVRAFELAALDYVVKPFQPNRLTQTMERIRFALSKVEAQEEKTNNLRGYLKQSETAVPLTKLWGEKENKTAVLVDYTDILWIEADSKKVFMQSRRNGRLAVRYTIKELESMLAPYSIVRVHKAYLVNLNEIAEVVPWFSGTFQLRMDDEAKTEIPMSRQYGKALKKLTGG